MLVSLPKFWSYGTKVMSAVQANPGSGSLRVVLWVDVQLSLVPVPRTKALTVANRALRDCSVRSIR